MAAKSGNRKGFIVPVALGAFGLLLMSFAFKPGRKRNNNDLPDLDSPPPPGGSGTSGSSTTQTNAAPSYEVSYSQALFEKEIETKVPTYYYKFTVQWIGGPNGSQMVVTGIDMAKTPIAQGKKIGTASGYLVKDKATGEVYVHTLYNGVNIVTPLEDVKSLASAAQSGIIGAYTYYFDASVKGKKAKALKSMSYQTFNASFVAGPNGSVLQIGNISTVAKTWNPDDDMGIASGYIIESGGKKYLHTLKGSTNYATLPVTGGVLLTA